MNKKNFINITAEALTDDTMKANYTGNVKNLNQLISLGGALLQTYICSAVEIIKQNTDEEIPDEVIQLTIMDALIDKIGNLLNISNTSLLLDNNVFTLIVVFLFLEYPSIIFFISLSLYCSFNIFI